MEESLYSDSIKLKFTHYGHRYQIDSGAGWKPVQGVTTILGKVVAKDGLVNWAANLAVQAMVDGATPDEAKKAHIRKKDAGADVGSEVHNYIENFIKTGKELSVTLEAEPAVVAFQEWLTQRTVKFLHSEIPVYSKKYDYCGTCDFVAEVDGRRYIGDWKTADPKKEWKNNKYTGKLTAYPEHFIQVAAYDQALCEMGYDSFDGHMIVYVTKGGTLHTFINKDVRANKNAWFGALSLSRRLQQLDNSSY